MRYKGGVISATPPTSSGNYQSSTAPGMWGLQSQLQFAGANNWPTQGNIQFSTMAVSAGVTTFLSNDGVSWSTVGGYPVFNNTQNTVCYNGTLWVLAPYFGPARYSTDGVNWVSVTLPGGNANVQGLSWNGSKFLIPTTGSNNFNTSPDGINWTAQTNPNTTVSIGANWYAIGRRGSEFCLLGNRSGYFVAATSTDGISWFTLEYYVGTSVTPTSVCSNGTNYVATLAGVGIYNAIGGSGWTVRYYDSSLGFNFSVYSQSLNLFVAGGVGYAYALINTYYTSSDGGTNWTSRTFPVNGLWYNMVWDSNASKFIVWEGNSARIYYSSDGINWTQGSNLTNIGGMGSKTLV